MQVVSNTSPLNYLVLIGLADILPDVFERVLAPPGVIEELRHPAALDPVRVWAASTPQWLEIVAPVSDSSALPLGKGESEALCLAQEVGADAVLLDERKAVRVARSLDLFAIGTLGVLRIAADRGIVDLRAALMALTATSFRMTDDLVRQVLADEQPKSDDEADSGRLS